VDYCPVGSRQAGREDLRPKFNGLAIENTARQDGLLGLLCGDGTRNLRSRRSDMVPCTMARTSSMHLPCFRRAEHYTLSDGASGRSSARR